MAEFGTAVFRAIADFSSVRTEAKKTEESLGKLGKSGEKLGDQVSKGTEKAGGAVGGLATKFIASADKMVGAGKKMTTSLTLPIIGIGGAAVNSFVKFDDAMNQSIAIMGEVSDVMKNEMAAAAREVGKTTVFSADEAGNALFFLASAGLDAQASIAALPKVAAFAQAGMFDLETATSLLVDSQSALGLKSDDAVKNMENMIRVSDVLVQANIASNGSVEQFASALQNKAAAAMRVFNIDMEEGVAVLAAFADKGTKGVDAGTKFEAFVRDLTKAALENKDAFESLGIEVFDAQGALKPIADIVEDMEVAFDGMSDAEKTAAFNTLKMTEIAASGSKTLLGSSDAIRTYETRLRAAGGATEEIAGKQLESFKGQLELAKGKIMEAAISLGQDLIPVVLKAADTIAGLVEWFDALPPGVKEFIIAAAGVTAVIGPMLVVMGKIVGTGARIVEAVTKVITKFVEWRTAAKITATQQQLTFDGMQGGTAKAGGLSSALGKMGAALGIAGVAFGVVTAVMTIYNQRKAEAKRKIEEMKSALVDETGLLNTNEEAWKKYIDEQSRFGEHTQIDDLNRIGVSMGELHAQLKRGESGWREFAAAAASTGEFTEVFMTTSGDYVDAMGNVSDAGKDAVIVGDKLIAGNDDLAASFLQEQAGLEAVARSTLEAELATDRLTDAQKLQLILRNDLLPRGKEGNSDLEEQAVLTAAAGIATGDLTDAQKVQALITMGLSTQTGSYAAANEEAAVAVAKNEASAAKLAGSEAFLAGQIDTTTTATGFLIDADGELVDAEKAAADKAKELDDRLNDLVDTQLAIFDSAIGFRKKLADVTTELSEYHKELGSGKHTTTEQQLLTDEMASSVLSLAGITAKAAEEQANLTGHTLTASEKNQIYIKSLQGTANTLAPGSPLRLQLEGYIGSLKKTEGTFQAEVKANTVDANEKVDVTADKLDIFGRIVATAKLKAQDDATPVIASLTEKLKQIAAEQFLIHVGASVTWNYDNIIASAEQQGLIPAGAGESGAIVGLARGGITTGPQVLVGEGRPQFPEVVIPTDPLFRDNARRLFDFAGSKLGADAAMPVAGSPRLEPTDARSGDVNVTIGEMHVMSEPTEDALAMKMRELQMTGVL